MVLHNPTKRVIDILNIISKNSDKLTFSNISKSLEIPKSTLSPILKTLVELEVLNLDPISQTYATGLGAFQIGQSYLKNLNDLDIIKSHMTTITNSCNETCQLGINHNNEVLYLTKVECSQPIKLMSSIGRNLPLYCTGLGRALLFNYSEKEIRNLYSNGLTQFTEKTVSNVDDLIKIINFSKKEGVAEEKAEVTIDACCVAVPLVVNNQIQAAIGISLPMSRATENHLLNIISLLKLHSQLISEELEALNIKSILA